MVQAKKATYAPYYHELRTNGITYLPLVWSSYGRPHPDAVRVLLTLARNTARRRGSQEYRGLARQTAARIASALWRRAANMVLACWPKPAIPLDVVGTS